MKSITILLIAYYVSLIIISFISLSETTNSITIDLHHPDLSPSSPRYDPSLSHYQRVANALQRLSVAASHRRNLASIQTPSASTTIENNGGSYLMTYKIGTPPVTVTDIFDTGSDLIGTPCEKLGNSSTLKKIACNDPRCSSFPERDPVCRGSCSYSLTYGDGSSNSGTLSTETITLGSVKFQNITFGCATKDSVGIVGAGGGSFSLIRQLRLRQFAYCLVSINSKQNSSKLHLGGNAAVPGNPIPLIRDNKRPTFYTVKLRSITVGNKTLSFEQNIILDTGTGMTKLPWDLYWSMIRALKTSLGSRKIVKDPNGMFDLCYASLRSKFPDITLHFGNVDVVWKQENVFASVGPNRLCFAAGIKGPHDLSILGNNAQVNFLVGFDLNSNTVTFKPTDCGSGN